ncbi:MAG TPA: hypothetical protein VJZ91_06235 [Blastocatellia bacterium]|nr:hypothetical protein [Blastocatellia bacterium]
MSCSGFIEEQLGDDLYDQVRARWLERNRGRYSSHEEAGAEFDRRWSNVTGFLAWTAEQGAVIADDQMSNAGALAIEMFGAARPKANCLPRRRSRTHRAK